MSIPEISAAAQSVMTVKSSGAARQGTDSGGVSEGKKDRTTLSSLLSSASAFMTPDVENTLPGTIRLDDIRAQTAFDKNAVDDELENVMASLGIERNVSFRLTPTRSGRIAVSGDFEGKEKLEGALNTNDDFGNRFRRMSANSSFIEAAERSLEFRKVYDIDPKAAVARYAYLFSDSTEYRFSFVYENGESSRRVDIVTKGGYS